MADNNKTQSSNAIKDLAFSLFTQRSGFAHGQSAENVARRCFIDATAFLKVSDTIGSEGLQPIEDLNPLDTAFARNLPKTHPINLMSREMGNVNRVKEVFEALEANPKAESYEPLGWGMPEVNQARALFPAVLERANKLQKASA